jgi:hypothetical protein
MNRRWTFQAGLLLLALLVVAGCGAKVSGVRESKDFRFDDIVKGHMAVGGVASIFEELSDKDSNRLATNLQISIQDVRKEYPITPMPELRNTMGKAEYAAMMKEYGTDGILSGETLQKVKAKIPERFLALVRVENDDIRPATWQHVADQRNAYGQITVREHIQVQVWRHIKVTANVYDLTTAKSVWNGLVSNQAVEEKRYPIRAMSDLQALTALIEAAQGNKSADADKTVVEKYPSPGPPPLYRLMPSAFEAFAGSLPAS